MTARLKAILDNLHKYNMEGLAKINFGLTNDVVYDALVVAPSYSPGKILKDNSFRYTELGSQSYCQGFLVEKDGLKIAWIKTAAGGCNMLDYLLICGELRFRKLIFAGTLANTYLKESIRDYVPLVGRSEEIQRKYEHSRCQVLTDMIYRIAKGKRLFGIRS